MTGALRRDVEFIREPEPMIFDRQSDAYYRLGQANLDILSYLTVSRPVSHFVEALNRQGVSVTKDEVMRLLVFLRQNNLLEPECGSIAARREQVEKQKEKTAFLRFSSAYIFFRFPPLRPERLYRRIAPYVSWLCGAGVVRTLAVPAVLGYLLLVRNFGMVADAFVASLSWAGLVRYFAAIVAMKIVRESVTAEFSVVAPESTSVYAWFDGPIAVCRLQDGVRVEKGDLVAEYETSAIAYRFESARSQLREIEAELELERQNAFSDPVRLGKVKLLEAQRETARVSVEEAQWYLDHAKLIAPAGGFLSLADCREG